VFDGSALRQASDAPALPYKARHVTLIRLEPGGRISQAQSVGDKRAMLAGARHDDCFLVAWTGQYRTDVFYVDDRSTIYAAIGMPDMKGQPL
jgi:hypothetical protein